MNTPPPVVEAVGNTFMVGAEGVSSRGADRNQCATAPATAVAPTATAAIPIFPNVSPLDAAEARSLHLPCGDGFETAQPWLVSRLNVLASDPFDSATPMNESPTPSAATPAPPITYAGNLLRSIRWGFKSAHDFSRASSVLAPSDANAGRALPSATERVTMPAS